MDSSIALSFSRTIQSTSGDFYVEQGKDYSKLPEKTYARVRETQNALTKIVFDAKEALRVKRESVQGGSDAERLEELDKVLNSL